MKAMLWWQAYICGAYGVGGGAGAGPQGMGFPAQQLGWAMTPQIATESPSIVPDGIFPHMTNSAGVGPNNPAGEFVFWISVLFKHIICNAIAQLLTMFQRCPLVDKILGK